MATAEEKAAAKAAKTAAAQPITKEPEGAPVPTTIQLTCPFGYLDDAEQHHFWQAGQIVSDPVEVADLIAHGAEHLDISEQ